MKVADEATNPKASSTLYTVASQQYVGECVDVQSASRTQSYPLVAASISDT